MTEEKIETKPYDELENPQILAFIQRYVETWNKTDAYMAVHPESSRAAAMSNSYRYWRNPTLQATLKVILDDLLMSNDELLAILMDIARGQKGTNKANQISAIKLIMESRGLLLHRTDVTTAGEKISWEQIINTEDVRKDKFGGVTVIDNDKPKY